MSGWIRLAVLCGVAAGIPAGVGSYTFLYARGLSYMTNDPAACANCHVMQQHFDAWQASSHHAVAVCNDCHTPERLVPKYFTKGLNGYHHSLAFTTGNFHEPIQITPRNAAITEAACRRCHPGMTQMIDAPTPDTEPISCVRCHRNVGHLH